jgi:hypothetical protein
MQIWFDAEKHDLPVDTEEAAMEEELGSEDAFASQVDLEDEEDAHEELASAIENMPHAGKSGQAATASLPSPNAISAMDNSLYFSAVGQPLSSNNRSSSSSSLFAIQQDCWGESSEDGSSSSCQSAAEEASVAHFADADGSIMHSALDQSLAFFSATSAWTRPSLLVVDGDHEDMTQITEECRAEEEECPPISEDHIASSSAVSGDASLTSSAQESIAADRETLRPQLTNFFKVSSRMSATTLQAQDNEQVAEASLQRSAGGYCHQGGEMLVSVPCDGGQGKIMQPSNMRQPCLTDERPMHESKCTVDANSEEANERDESCLLVLDGHARPPLSGSIQETCTQGTPALSAEKPLAAAAPDVTKIGIPSDNATQASEDVVVRCCAEVGTGDLGTYMSSLEATTTEVVMGHGGVDGQGHDQTEVHSCTLPWETRNSRTLVLTSHVSESEIFSLCTKICMHTHTECKRVVDFYFFFPAGIR